MKAHVKKAVIGLSRFGISVGLVGVLLWKVGVEETIERLQLLEWHWGVAAILLILTTVVLHSARWRLVISTWGYVMTKSLALRETWIGYFFSQLLPTSVGGDAVRAYRRYRAGASPGVAFRGVLVERVFGLLACVALSVLAVPVMFAASPNSIATHATAIVVAGAVCASWMLLTAPRWMLRVLPERFGKEIRLVSQGILHQSHAKAAMAISVLMQAAIAGSVACLSEGLGLAVNPLLVAVLFQPVTLFTLLPVSLAGWGLREGALVATLGAVGVSAAEALPLSLAFGAILLFISLPGWFALVIGKPEVSRAVSNSVTEDG